MENVKHINKYLESTYGRALDNKPKFRVAFSNDMFEVRTGLFERYTESGIFLGSAIETKKVPKYSYIKDKYVLEVYTRAFPEIFGRSIVQAEGIVKEGDFYEPLRVFRTKKGDYLPPNLDVCKIICDRFIELINRPPGQRLTEKIAMGNEKAEVDAEVAKFFDILSQDDSDLMQKFRYQEATILPGKEFN